MFEPKSDQRPAQRADGRDGGFEPPRPKPLFGVGSFLRHARLIGACGLAFLLLAGAAAVLKSTKYTASTQLLVYNRELQPGPESIILKGRADTSLVQNEIEIIQSRLVLTRVAETLNLDKASTQPSFVRELLHAVGGWFARPQSGSSPASQTATSQAVEALKGRLAVRRIGTSHAISIAITEADPAAAAQTANEVARAYLQARAASSSLETTRDLALRERLQGLGPNAYVISAAEPPLRPDGPKASMIVILGLAVGLGFGGALALVLDFADRTIRTPEQAEFVLGMECLGVVPDLAGGETRHGMEWREAARRSLAAIRKPGLQRVQERLRQRGGGREETAIRAARSPNPRIAPMLRRAAALIATRPETASIGITSTVPGEGATTLAANLACLLAGDGRKVLLLDAMPRPGSHASQLTSLSSLAALMPPRSLSSSARAAAGELARPDVSALDRAPTDSDAAWKASLDARVREATKAYDLVIVDLPALADGANVRLAAPSFDALLLVIKWGDTDSELVQQALHSSGRARSKFVGAILNFVDERMIGTYGDRLAVAQMVLAAPDTGLDRSTPDAPATLPAGAATKVKA